MRILELSDGAASLEFEYSQRNQIIASIEGLGPITRRRYVDHDVLVVAGAEFIFQYEEWDGPSLISKDASGTAILQKLLADLSDTR